MTKERRQWLGKRSSDKALSPFRASYFKIIANFLENVQKETASMLKRYRKRPMREDSLFTLKKKKKGWIVTH